jgi:hypothetical protein
MVYTLKVTFRERGGDFLRIWSFNLKKVVRAWPIIMMATSSTGSALTNDIRCRLGLTPCRDRGALQPLNNHFQILIIIKSDFFGKKSDFWGINNIY